MSTLIGGVAISVFGVPSVANGRFCLRDPAGPMVALGGLVAGGGHGRLGQACLLQRMVSTILCVLPAAIFPKCFSS